MVAHPQQIVDVLVLDPSADNCEEERPRNEPKYCDGDANIVDVARARLFLFVDRAPKLEFPKPSLNSAAAVAGSVHQPHSPR
jgi:hypothetical protein